MATFNRIKTDMVEDRTTKQKLSDHLSSLDTSLAEKAAQADLNVLKNGIFVKDYGAMGDGITNDATAIQNAINAASTSGGGIVYLMSLHLINTTVSIPSNITLKHVQQCIIKSTNDYGIVLQTQTGASNVGIENITFDYGSNNANTALYIGEDTTGLKVNNLSFQNFYGKDNTKQLLIFRFLTGVSGSVKGITFKNIKQLGNGTGGDLGGMLRCLLTTGSGSVNLNKYNLNISDIVIENVYNVDSNGVYIVEDSDPIYFQHTGVNGHINLSNISAKNFGKRLIKIQSDGINISHIFAQSDYWVQWLIMANGNDIAITNVVAQGNISSICYAMGYNGLTISNINLDSNATTNAFANSLFVVESHSNVSISNVVSSGSPAFLNLIASTADINHITLSNITATVAWGMINTTITSGYKLKNINLSDITIIAPNNNITQTSFYITGDATNHANMVNIRNMKIFAGTNYAFGTLKLEKIDYLSIDGLYVENLATNTPLLLAIVDASGYIRNFRTGGNAFSNAIDMNTTQNIAYNLLLTRAKTGNILMHTTYPTVELEKCSGVTTSYAGGATSTQVTIT